MEVIAFYGFSAMAMLAAALVLLMRELMYAALALLVCLLCVAALFVLAGADFIAIAQIMIYVGGVLVLLIFGIMLTHQGNRANSQNPNRIYPAREKRGLGAATAIFVFFLLFRVIMMAQFVIQKPDSAPAETLRKTGILLMTSHLLPFEIIAFLLLIALVGAAYLAMNRKPIR